MALSTATQARLHYHFASLHKEMRETYGLARATADAVGDICMAILESEGTEYQCVEGTRRSSQNIISQACYLEWAVKTFGAGVKNPKERAMRMLEEAMELAQTQGVTLADMDRLAGRVMSRPVGQVHQEIGGTMFTLFSLSENLGYSAIGCAEQDLLRVLAEPAEKFTTKHAEKVRDGVSTMEATT